MPTLSHVKWILELSESEKRLLIHIWVLNCCSLLSQNWTCPICWKLAPLKSLKSHALIAKRSCPCITQKDNEHCSLCLLREENCRKCSFESRQQKSENKRALWGQWEKKPTANRVRWVSICDCDSSIYFGCAKQQWHARSHNVVVKQ